jgi:hypothetical protein
MVDLVITPEPDPEERAAIVAAAGELLSRGQPAQSSRSPWRQVGIVENLDRDAEEAVYGETGRPRSSPGATRA